MIETALSTGRVTQANRPFGATATSNGPLPTGSDLRVCDWASLGKALDVEAWFERSRGEQSQQVRQNLNRFVPLTTRVCARDEQEAFGEAARLVRLLRGIMNFALVRRRYAILSTPWRPAAEILMPPMHGVFDGEGCFKVEFLHQTVGAQYGTPALGLIEWKIADQFLEALADPLDENSTDELIAEALSRYDDALQDVDWSDGFFVLWQVLEGITHLPRERTVDIKNVCERVARMLGNDSFVRELLDVIANERNRLVHRGQAPGDPLKEFGFLKILVEDCVEFLLSHREALSTRNDLMVFFRYAGMPGHELANHARIIEGIRRGRV